jgi:hypothetical protein
MPTLRPPLAGALILLLSGLSASAAALSDDDSAAGPTGVIVNVARENLEAQGHPKTVSGAAHTRWEGDVVSFLWGGSEPRLKGTATFAFTVDDYESTVGAGLEAVAVTVVNDEGSWTGYGRGIGSEEYGDNMWLQLNGEGAYEGYTAYLTADLANEYGTIRGVIIAGDLPPFPEPPEPVTN